MRYSRSGLAPGANRSISLSIVNGSTFFSRKASVRKMIVVSETIEQTRSGHIKMPPLAKNPVMVWKVSDISVRIKLIRINDEVHSFNFEAFWRQTTRKILRDRRELRFEDGLQANICERLVRCVLGDFQILDMPASIDEKMNLQRADVRQLTPLVHVIIPARADRILEYFFVTSERSAERVHRGDSSIADIAGNARLFFERPITGSHSARCRSDRWLNGRFRRRSQHRELVRFGDRRRLWRRRD